MSRPAQAALEAPGLSATLTGPVAPDRCQGCSRRGELTRWREHDAQDQPTPVLVVLCRRCSDQLIEAHPRLYHGLWPNEPVPGSLEICIACTHRAGTTCRHPDLKANGGSGLTINIKKPTRAFLCGRGRSRSGLTTIWPSPARDCAGRTVDP